LAERGYNLAVHTPTSSKAYVAELSNQQGTLWDYETVHKGEVVGYHQHSSEAIAMNKKLTGQPYGDEDTRMTSAGATNREYQRAKGALPVAPDQFTPSLFKTGRRS
jgi:hypothetical protein